MFEWTEDRVESLKYWMRRGFSATDIARKLGATSRNAVLGKIHRGQLREGFKWDAFNEEKLRALWDTGANCSAIAKRLAAPSASSVYSKAMRMGLPARPDKPAGAVKPGRQGKRVVPVTLAGPAVVHAAALSWPADLPPIVRKRRPDEGVSYFETGPGMCKFPLWPDTVRVPLEMKMHCGDPVEIGRSYCASCRAVMTTRVTLQEWRKANRQ